MSRARAKWESKGFALEPCLSDNSLPPIFED